MFIDIRPDTLNMDPSKIEAAITPRTKAICAVHYAGVGCEMDEILAIIRRYRQATDLPLFARPNAGTPSRSVRCTTISTPATTVRA